MLGFSLALFNVACCLFLLLFSGLKLWGIASLVFRGCLCNDLDGKTLRHYPKGPII
jgi:hypothetical protein